MRYITTITPASFRHITIEDWNKGAARKSPVFRGVKKSVTIYIMSKVYIRNAEYEYKRLKPVVFELMNSLDGEKIQKNSRVVIKPNLLAPASPDKAMITHPLLIKAAAEYVLDRRARPVISDSPAVGSFEKILAESGIRGALDGMHVEFREFKETVPIDVGRPFHKIDISADVMHADVVINLPKLKTHSQMLLTLGIKNLFGCIVGMKKPEWHLRTGVDRETFARLLVKIYQAVQPAITIMDGILSMQGQGPGRSGEPRHLGIIMGSRNAADIDSVICRMLGVLPEHVLTNKLAKEFGLLTEEIIIDGDVPFIKDFKLPDITPVVFGPEMFHGFIRRHLVQRPACDDDTCKLCGECWKYCPAHAIRHDKKRIHFDYDSCIRCYCCIEVCPHGALRAHESFIGKCTRKLLKM